MLNICCIRRTDFFPILLLLNEIKLLHAFIRYDIFQHIQGEET